MKEKYQPLFDTFTFQNGIELKNRIVLAPMTNFSSNPDGTVTDAELEYYIRRSGGVGTVITACTYVTKNGKGFHNEFAADTDEMIPSLARLAKAIKDAGAKAILQIFHGGRECPPELVDGDVVSASAVQSERSQTTPRALEDAEVQEIVDAFGEVTRRAIEAGYDGVEIHGANGYLVQQFFSPHSNRREDRWGGSLEKRLTFPLAVVDAVQKAVTDHAKEPFIVGYRFSPEEPETPGITMEETMVLLDALLEKNLDYLHVSLQDFWSEPRRGVADTTKPRIEHIIERVAGRVPVMGVGSIFTADDALKALQTVPLLAIGRELIAEPDWVQLIAEGREDEIKTVIYRREGEQQRLVIPDPLWNAIMSIPGWFRVED